MKLKLTGKKKIAVLVTAICLSVLLVAWWLVMLFITVNTLRNYDYLGHSRARVVSFDLKDASDPSVYGVAVFYDSPTFSKEVSAVKEAGKTSFIFVDKLSEKEISAFLEECRELSVLRYSVVVSKSRGTLEKFSRTDASVLLIWQTNSALCAYLGNRMGYNCSLSEKKMNESFIERAHDEANLICVFDVSDEKLSEYKRTEIDYIFLKDRS